MTGQAKTVPRIGKENTSPSDRTSALGLGFRVNGFWPAFWGALVVSIISTLLSILVRDPGGRE